MQKVIILALLLFVVLASCKNSNTKQEKKKLEKKIVKAIVQIQMLADSEALIAHGATLQIVGSGVRIRSGPCTDKKV